MKQAFSIPDFADVAGYEERNQHLDRIFSVPAYPLVTGIKITLDLEINVTSEETPATPLDYSATVNTFWNLTTRNFATDDEFGALPWDNVDGIVSGEFCLFWQSLKRQERIAMWTLHAYKAFTLTVSGTDDAGGAISTTWPAGIVVKGLFKEDDSSTMVHVPYDQTAGSRLISGASDAFLAFTLVAETPDPPTYSVPGEIGGVTSKEFADDPAIMMEVPEPELFRDGGTVPNFATSITDHFTGGDDFAVEWKVNDLVVEFTT